MLFVWWIRGSPEPSGIGPKVLKSSSSLRAEGDVALKLIYEVFMINAYKWTKLDAWCNVLSRLISLDFPQPIENL